MNREQVVMKEPLVSKVHQALKACKAFKVWSIIIMNSHFTYVSFPWIRDTNIPDTSIHCICLQAKQESQASPVISGFLETMVEME